MLYRRTCDLKQLFSERSRTLENNTHTEATLLQHCKRAAYQGGYARGQALILSLIPPKSS